MMALLRYSKPIEGLSDPRGSVTSSIPAQAIAISTIQIFIKGSKDEKGFSK